MEDEKVKLKDDMHKMEDEIAATIMSYKEVLESFGRDEETDIVKIRKEMI